MFSTHRIGSVRLALLFAFAGGACGSVSPLANDGGAGAAGHDGGSGADAAAGDGGSGGTVDSGDAGADRAPGCPASASLGTVAGGCTAGQTCEYRAPGAAPDCVTRLECYASVGGAPSWHSTPPETGCGTHPAPCPSTFSALAQGSACPVAGGTSCDYAEGRCECLPCGAPGVGVTASMWSCRAWDSGGTGCPTEPPLAGAPCASPDQFCYYAGVCSIAVGDDFKCSDGYWQTEISPSGSCVLRSCGSSGADAGVDGAVDHPPDECAQPSDCPGGSCWEQLDGSRACVVASTSLPLNGCQVGDQSCCSKDADCAQSAHGRCLPRIDLQQNFCGGAVPQGNACRYDQCGTDADCKAATPTGATVATCLPAGALGVFGATCAYGACRTDADCTLHPGGQCQYGLAATNGVCDLRDVLFCAYPSDPCQTTSGGTTGCSPGFICVPNDNYQGRSCGKPPPMYP